MNKLPSPRFLPSMRHHFAASTAQQNVLRMGACWLDTLQRQMVVGMDVDWPLLRLEAKP